MCEDKRKDLYNDSFQSGDDGDGRRNVKSDLIEIKEEIIEEFTDEPLNPNGESSLQSI